MQQCSIENEIARLEQFLKTVKGETFDICAKIYLVIESSREPAQVLRWLFEKGYYVESDESIEVEAYITLVKYKEMRQRLEKDVQKLLDDLIKQNVAEIEFYQSLWNSMNDVERFCDKAEQIYALYSIYIDPRVPYFQLCELVTMENETVLEITTSIENDIKKLIYLLFYEFEQKTEEAAALLDVLDSKSNKEEKIVLMAHLLQKIRKIASSED